MIFHRIRELRKSREKVNKSREAARKKNLLVDIFTNTQINTIGPFDWKYRGDGGDICYCNYCVYISTREKLCLKITAVLSLYKRSRFVCVLH